MARIDLIHEFGNESGETFNKISRGYSMGIKDGVDIFYDNLLMGLDKAKRLMIADGEPEKDIDKWYRNESGWIKAAYEFTKDNIKAGID